MWGNGTIRFEILLYTEVTKIGTQVKRGCRIDGGVYIAAIYEPLHPKFTVRFSVKEGK